jgi:sRNA-binding protein
MFGSETTVGRRAVLRVDAGQASGAVCTGVGGAAKCGDNSTMIAMTPPDVSPDDALPPPSADSAVLPQTPVAAPAVPELTPTACASRLGALFPAVFGPGVALPLKLRIQADIQQRAPATFTKKTLSLFLHRHTTGSAYLRALVQAPARVDLDGQPAGEVADEHRQAAVAELERRRAVHEARRAAEREVQRQQQRQGQELARQQRQADDEAWRAQSALLHAFETSTLTRANFCALKGLTDSELESRLTAARQLRDQRAQAQPAQPERPRAPQRAPQGRPTRQR